MKKEKNQQQSAVKSGTTKKRCQRGCKHAFQDKTYGAGVRVHNIMKSGSMRCTVCGFEEHNK